MKSHRLHPQMVELPILHDYRRYHTGVEPISFRRIRPVSSKQYGVEFEWDVFDPCLKRIEWAEEKKSFQTMRNGRLFIPFSRTCSQEQVKRIQIRLVMASRKTHPVYQIRIHWMTKAAFQAVGGHRTRDIVKVTTDPRMDFGDRPPDQWVSRVPTVRDRAFAKKRWGRLLKGVKSDIEKAKILTKALMKELHGHGGMPQAMVYRLTPFEKLEAILSGKTGFACGQYSEIFSHACQCFGINNRRGYLNDGIQNDDILVELGSSHLVTEVFDSELNQWVFMDGHQETLAAYLGSIGPLTLQEVLLFMNQPQRRKHLEFQTYNVKTGREKRIQVDRFHRPLLSYRGWSKVFRVSIGKPLK